MGLELHYGGAVSGEQKFARPALEARFLDLFRGGAGIKMFGLRRIGKSTLRLHLCRVLGLPYQSIWNHGFNNLNTEVDRKRGTNSLQSLFVKVVTKQSPRRRTLWYLPL
ncbi:MAG: hypothetical protein MUE46_10900 [Xanthomonadales bacterium]|nr:hypothetical protein [Xanthomonadales bacterium]